MHPAAFNPAHIQNIIQQAQQMITGGHDFFEVILHLLGLLDVGQRQRRETNDCIHRRADIVRHIRKENAFRLAGPVGLHQCILQLILLFHLAADLFIYAADTDYDAVVAVVPAACTHYLRLKIFHYTFAGGTIIAEINVLLAQLFFQEFT